MTNERIEEIIKYIALFQKSCEAFLSPLCNPQNKKVLVIGSGWGTEVAWLLSKGASEIVGVDPAPRPAAPLDEYIKRNGLSGKYEIMKGGIEDLVECKEHYFDLIVSHNVFEHIMDLESVFATIPRLLTKNGRVAIFTAPLFYSSYGSHMHIDPWEHLWGDLDSIKERVPAYQWSDYQHGLNKMTVTTFLEEIKKSNGFISQFYLRPDKNISKYPLYKDKLREVTDLSPFDLTTEGISVELFYSVR